MSGQLSCSSPANKVGSNDDLLTEILLRLPVRSLLRFKSVSKHWYSIISSSSFKLIRSRNPDPHSGLFVLANKRHLECELIPFDINNPIKPPFKTLHFDPNVKEIDIEHSGNGLMLCSSERIDSSNRYYVYNPTINEFAMLPKFKDYDDLMQLGINIAFDPLKSPYYRILFVCGYIMDIFTGETTCEMQMYSSETRTCKVSYRFTLDEGIDMFFVAGVYWNDAIHWVHHQGFIVYFNLDQETLHRILTPSRLLGLDHNDYTNYIFESRDQFLVVEINRNLTSKFKIHEMKRDYSGWFVKYLVDLDQVPQSFPEIINPQSGVTFEFVVLSLVLGENEDESFLVLKIHGKAERFNLVSKTFYKLYDFATSHISAWSFKFNEVEVKIPIVFQFRESLYMV